MTNYDKIKSMSVEEMAKTINKHVNDCFFCAWNAFDDDNCDGTELSCNKGIEKWLESEVEEW